MIWMPFAAARRREYHVAPLDPADAEAIAVLHAEDFIRPWSEDEFVALLDQDTVFGFAARAIGRPGAPAGFVLARHAAGEAEILTIAVARAARRGGIGRELMDAVLRELHALRAEALFLEVDETNVAAIGLYRKLGFRQVGSRPAYYGGKGVKPKAALVMRRDLK